MNAVHCKLLLFLMCFWTTVQSKSTFLEFMWEKAAVETWSRNLGGRRGTHCLLELKCRTLYMVAYHILKPTSKVHGYSCTIAYFVSPWFEFCTNSRYCRSSASPISCWVWVCPLAQQAAGMSDSYTQLLQPPDIRPMLLVRTTDW